MTLPFLCCAVITSVSALISLGFSLAAVVNAPAAGRVDALYTLSRSVALAIGSLASFLIASPAWLEAMATTMSLVQLGDALIGLRLRDTVKTVGPLLTSALNLAALFYLMNA